MQIKDKMKRLIPDSIFLKIKYKRKMNKKLNLKNPITFNEKMQWLKLYNRKIEYTKMVDKYEVKKYIADTIGEEYVIPTLGIYDKFRDIDFEKLPNQFVIKCTHDSGSTVVCKNKKEINYEKLEDKINKCLKNNFFYNGREWPYKYVKPRIIIEKYMENSTDDNLELKDYKFMCFNGKVRYSFVCSDRFSEEGLKVTFFDRDWNKMPFERHYKASLEDIKKPKNYEKMIQLSEILAKEIPFVRVDFYEIKEKIFFGELTFFPGSGFEEFSPEQWDEKLGNMIILPEKN